MNKIAILIPCYNESKTIAKVIKDYRNIFPEADIYVYDNNSTDGTDVIARKAGAIVHYEYKQGKGNVIRAMFRSINADCYLIIDGDDTYPAENAKKMCRLVLQNNVDMVIGDRLSSTYFKENKRLFHSFGNILVRKCINTLWYAPQPIVDVMTGYRAFSPIFVKSFPILSQGFEIETEMTIHALDKNFSIASVPVNYRNRPVGSESKLSTYSDGVKVLFTIFNLYRDYKPFKFFCLISIIMLLLATILFVPVFMEYLKIGLVPRLPTLIVSTILMLAAFLSGVCGLILDTISDSNRKNFEIQMNIIRMILKR